MATIYIFTFPNGKQYIGQSVNLAQRYRRHKRCSQQECAKQVVDRAIKKYGWSNVIKDEIECAEEFLDEVEQTWIKNFETMDRKYGYNRDSGGNANKHASDITLRRQSESKTGNKNPMFGRTQSKETRLKQSISATGRQGYWAGRLGDPRLRRNKNVKAIVD
jgi:group I intron endonuclease